MICRRYKTFLKTLFSIFFSYVFLYSVSLWAVPLTEPQVGETHIFNKYNQGFFVGYSKISATCQAKGENIIVYTQDAQVQGLYGEVIGNSYMLFAATTTGIYASADSGKSWEFLSYVFDIEDEEEQTEPLGENFISVTPGDKILLTGTSFAFYWSNNNGASWRKLTRGLPSDVPFNTLVYDTTEGSAEKTTRKFLASDGGLYYIQDVVGRSWIDLNDGMPLVPPNPAPAYDIVLLPDSMLFVASEFGPFKGWIDATGNQFSWQPLVKKDLQIASVISEAPDSKKLSVTKQYDGFSIGTGSHVYIMDTQSGAMWATSPEEDESGNLVVTLSAATLYFTANFNGDYNTLEVSNIKMSITGSDRITQIERAENGTLFASGENGVLKINADGSMVNIGLQDKTINTLYLNGNMLLAGTTTGLYQTDIDNPNWTKISTRLSDGYDVDLIDPDVRDIIKNPAGEYLLGCYLGGVIQGNVNNWTTKNLGLAYRIANQEDIARMINSFDNSSAANPTVGIFEKTTQYFGNVPDIDGVNKIFVLITDLDDDYFLEAGNGIDYIYNLFDPADQSTKAENENSNQRDILYLDNYPTNLSEYDEAEASVAHALTQMIEFNYDQDEEEWLTEGLCMWARWINGYKFYNNPDESYLNLTATLSPVGWNNILRWGDVTNLKSERETSFVLFNYFFEKYLLDSTKVQQLVQDQDNGMTSVTKFLGSKSFSNFYTDWIFTLYFDRLGQGYKDGKYYLNNINVLPKSLTLDWGLIAAPPYIYEFPGWAYYYFVSEGWNGIINASPQLDSAYVFNGDDVSEYKVFMIEQPEKTLDETAVITELQLNEYNRAIDVPEFKTSAEDTSKYKFIACLVISNEPATTDGGSISISNDMTPPQRASFYPLQNSLMENYFEFYALCDEKAFVDGGQAVLLGINDELVTDSEGPQVVATSSGGSLTFTLEPFMSNDRDVFVYHGFYNLDSIMTGESGQVSFVENGEDLAGNKFSISMGPLQYKKILPDQVANLQSEDNSFMVNFDQSLKKKTLVTLYTLSKENTVYFENKNEIEPVSNTFIVGPVGKSVENATISISYSGSNIVGDDLKLSVYYKDGKDWLPLESKVDPKSRKVFANINKLGQFRLQYGTTESDIVETIPTTFDLQQNYPNPFNPATTIKYQIPNDSHVILSIYNILGQKIKTLVNDYQNAGYYQYRFNITSEVNSNLGSGIYFYTIQAGDYFATRKMVLMK